MDRMIMSPAQKRREDEQPQAHAKPRVCASGGDERSVGTVMEEDEGAYQEACRGQRKGESQQVGDAQREVYGDRQCEVRDHRGGYVEQRAPVGGLGVWG